MDDLRSPFSFPFSAPLGRLRRLFLILALFFAGSAFSHAATITEYRVTRELVASPAGKTLVAVRSFRKDGVAHRLAFDPATLIGYDLPADALKAKGADEAWLVSTALGRALQKYDAPPFKLQNTGAARAERDLDGEFLTVDLCPSKRPFEREMFEAAAALGKGRAVPVAVAITGVWLATHPDEVAFLKGEVAAGRLAITWVNHSWHHHYDPKVPLEQNFLLAPGTDFLSEVLEVEQQLLAQGLVPSPFFRFPGLVSDRATVTALRELSLIPIGSDAWLAKGEKPRRGSFILVHGNGNEPKGIRLLMPLLKGNELRLLPLPAAFGG